MYDTILYECNYEYTTSFCTINNVMINMSISIDFFTNGNYYLLNQLHMVLSYHLHVHNKSLPPYQYSVRLSGKAQQKKRILLQTLQQIQVFLSWLTLWLTIADLLYKIESSERMVVMNMYILNLVHTTRFWN